MPVLEQVESIGHDGLALHSILHIRGIKPLTCASRLQTFGAELKLCSVIRRTNQLPAEWLKEFVAGFRHSVQTMWKSLTITAAMQCMAAG